MMKEKNCILNINKICNNCGECDRCDLNPEKICDSCGKCLEMDENELRAIKIDEIIEDEDEADEDKQIVPEDELSSDDREIDENIEYIDDIDGLREILENDKKFSEVAEEEYPGFIRLKSNTKKI